MHLIFSLLVEKNQAIPVQKMKGKMVFSSTGNWRENEEEGSDSGGTEISYGHPPSQRIQKPFTNWVQITAPKNKMLLSLRQKYSGCAHSPDVQRNAYSGY